MQLVNQQYNRDPFEKMVKYASNRDVLDRFEQASARLSVEADLQMVGHYDQLLKQLEANLLRQATRHDPQACSLLRTIPGIGKILSLVLLYEIHTIDRFPSVGDFLSYCQAGHAEADQRRQGHRTRWRQNRQRAFEVGVLRGRALDAPLQR